MSNVLADDKHHQIVALGRLGWSLRRIERATDVRRETISGYLKAAGIVVRGRGRRRQSKAKPAISPEAVSTDCGEGNPAISEPVSTDSGEAKPATRAAVSTDSAPVPRPGRAPSASACEPYRELISDALRHGRNAMAIWQDLVDDHGFTARYASVRRFVLTLKGTSSPEARVVITTAPGEEGQVDYGDGPMVRHPQTGKYRRTRLFVLTLGYPADTIEAWAGSVTDESIRRFLSNPDHEIRLLAELDGQPAGLGSLVVDKAELRACYVVPEAARRGVGSALVTEMERIARDRGLTHLELHASVNAEPFYTALGYEGLERKDHVLRSGLRMAAVKMRKNLKV